MIITLSSPSNATLGSDKVHTFTIIDDDDQPTIDFNVTSSSGLNLFPRQHITVDLSAASSSNITRLIRLQLQVLELIILC